MPRRDEAISGAAGREAVAIHRDVDLTDVFAAIDFLPTLRREKGRAYATEWGRTQLRSKLALLGLADPKTTEEAQVVASTAVIFHRGVLWAMEEDDTAGFLLRADVKTALTRILFEPSVRAVFKRTAATAEETYAPQLPTGK